MRRVLRGLLVALLGAAGALAVGGCADPEGELKAFADRCADQVNAGDTDGGTTCDPVPEVKSSCDFSCTNPAAGVLDGTFFYTLSASVADDIPLVFLATATSEETDGQLYLTWSLQPLAKADRKTPAGPPITVGPMLVVDGSLAYLAKSLSVEDGAANPISGSPIAAENLLISTCPGETRDDPQGMCETADFYCGTIPQGTVVKPTKLDISGSTWTMVRVSGSGTDDYPEPPPINCAMDPAKAVTEL
ncbi:MAG: hypothetical protein KC766_15915 [Myxococcales bacterium]|nr:hypothetical protein [Myxococcales bacterium]